MRHERDCDRCGIVGPWFLSPFRALPEPVHYIILRPVLDVAIERCRLRGGDTLSTLR